MKGTLHLFQKKGGGAKYIQGGKSVLTHIREEKNAYLYEIDLTLE